MSAARMALSRRSTNSSVIAVAFTIGFPKGVYGPVASVSIDVTIAVGSSDPNCALSNAPMRLGRAGGVIEWDCELSWLRCGNVRVGSSTAIARTYRQPVLAAMRGLKLALPPDGA